jgi:hypothetical protein
MAFNKIHTFTGLGTFALPAVPANDAYTVTGTLTVPEAPNNSTQGPGGGANNGNGDGLPVPSQVVVAIKLNGSTLFTTQSGARGFAYGPINCLANDILSVTLSSALASDGPLNSVKITLGVTNGPL